MSLVSGCSHEFLELTVQPFAHIFCVSGKMQIVYAIHTEHPRQLLLQPRIIVLQCEIEDRAFVNGVLPQRNTTAHMLAELRHKEGFTDLWRSGE